MTREEAMEALEQCVDWAEHTGRRYVDTVPADALKMAFEALKREQQLLDAGYQNATVDFYIGGRLFRAKEIAQ